MGLRDGENVRATLTTDLIETNPGITFRNAKGQFASPDPDVTELTNQLKVNRYLYDRMVERGVTIDVFPPDIRANGTFWFCNSEDTMQLFIFHEESDAWIPVAPPATISDRVAAGEEAQAGLIEAVGNLESKVTALEGAVGEHSLVFTTSNSSPRAGEFNLKNQANQMVNALSDAKFIYLSYTDRAGNTINIDRITEGDVMRLSDISGVTAELKIVNDGVGGGMFGIEKLFGELDRLSERPYEFTLFSSFDPQGLATIDYVDAQDAKKVNVAGDTMTGTLTVKRETGDEASVIAVAGDDVRETGHIIQVNTASNSAWGPNKQVFYVANNGGVGVHPEWVPNKEWHLTSKKYVDDRALGVPYVYRHKKDREQLARGECTGPDKDWDFYASQYDALGRKVGPSAENKQTITVMLKIYTDDGDMVYFNRHNVLRHGTHGINNLMWASSSDIYNGLTAADDGKTFYLSDGCLLPN